MSKKSTTKITILLFSILSCLVLHSCADPNNNVDDTPSKDELYKSIIGTWIFEESDEGKSYVYSNLLITDDSIRYIYDSGNYGDCICNFENISTIADMKQVNENSINPYNDYGPKKEQLSEALTPYPRYQNFDLCNYEIHQYSTEMINHFLLFKLQENKLYVLFATFSTAEDIWTCHENTYKLDKTSSTGNPNNPEGNPNNPETSITESNITGSYIISEAIGSTFTFASDGTWTYKYNSSSSNGTWSVSDGELTITYSLGGYSSTAVFTASVSGDTYTLIGKSGDYTTVISSAFKITDQEALENGVVTLFVKQ